LAGPARRPGKAQHHTPCPPGAECFDSDRERDQIGDQRCGDDQYGHQPGWQVTHDKEHEGVGQNDAENAHHRVVAQIRPVESDGDFPDQADRKQQVAADEGLPEDHTDGRNPVDRDELGCRRAKAPERAEDNEQDNREQTVDLT
jgi:hypothetical protein